MSRIRLPGPGTPEVSIGASPGESLASLPRDEIVALYKTHGALHLRGFGANLAQFGAFARSFCKTAVVNESPNREPLDPANRVYSVDGGAGAFPLHPELSREPWKPDAAFFACLAPPGEGGETTICDGIALARSLPREVRAGLAGRRLVYGMGTWPGLLEYWLGTSEPDDALLAAPPRDCPYVFGRRPDGRIVRHFSRPALHRPMFRDEPAFGNFLLFARYNNGRRDFPLLDDLRPVPGAWVEAAKLAGDALTRAVAWEQGDVLMLDNTRFMHGRRAIHDQAKRRIATYFGYLDFALPDPEEPPDPVWRREDFEPPRPPGFN
jgi:hypothetical protein